MPIKDESERQRRWDLVRGAMRDRGLQCLLVYATSTSWRKMLADFTYLSNVLHEGFLVFPLEGDPTIVGFRGIQHTVPNAWVSDWRGGHPQYSQVVSERIRELGLEEAKIGIVQLSGYFGEWGFPHSAYTALEANFPKAAFEDATDILTEARKVKSPVEVGYFERGCEIGEQVIEEVARTARPGVQDYVVVTRIMNALYEGGCEPSSMLLYKSGKEVKHAGEGGTCSPPSHRVLEEGDMILLEFDAKYGGYEVQFNQTFSLGAPSEKLQRLAEVAAESFYRGLETLKPGVTVGELDDAFMEPIKKSGLSYTHPAFHGLGLSLEEPMGNFPLQPTYKPPRDERLQAGMVIEFEPQVVSPDHKMGIHLGVPVLVTESGSRMLTKNWKPEIRVVQGT